MPRKKVETGVEELPLQGGSREGAGRKPASNAAPGTYERYSIARADLEEHKAKLAAIDVQTSEIELEEKTGKLISVEAARESFSEVIKDLTSTLSTLPDILERDAGLSAKQVTLVKSAVSSLRNRMANYLISFNGAQ